MSSKFDLEKVTLSRKYTGEAVTRSLKTQPSKVESERKTASEKSRVAENAAPEVFTFPQKQLRFSLTGCSNAALRKLTSPLKYAPLKLTQHENRASSK